MRKNNSVSAGLSQNGVAPKSLAEAGKGFNQKEKIMKNLQNYLFVSILAVAVLFVGAASVAAQDVSDLPPTANQLEQFRADLSQTLSRVNASVMKIKQNPTAREAIDKSGKDSPKLNDAAQKRLEKMSYEQLEQLYTSFNTHFPNWRESAGVMSRIAEKVGGEVSRNKNGIGNSEAVVADNCQEAFNAAPSFSDWSIAKSAEVAAQAVFEGLPEPTNVAALAIWAPLSITVSLAEFYNNLFDRCQGDQDVADIKSAIDNSKSEILTEVANNGDSIVDQVNNHANSLTTQITNNDNTNKTAVLEAITNAQTNITVNSDNNATTITANFGTAITSAKTEIINNDNSNRALIITNNNINANTINNNLTNAKDAIINNNNTNTTTLNTAITNAKTELRNLLLRSQIEADLATESNSVKVAWYMTPTANGGHLDFVKQIVTETLANIVAAGGSIGNAQSFLDRANADKAAGNFKSAYDNYRKAYKAAVN